MRYSRNIIDSLCVHTAFLQGKIKDSGHLLNLNMKLKPIFPKTRAGDLYRNFSFIAERLVDVLEELLLEQGAVSSETVTGLATVTCRRGAKLCRAI